MRSCHHCVSHLFHPLRRHPGTGVFFGLFLIPLTFDNIIQAQHPHIVNTHMRPVSDHDDKRTAFPSAWHKKQEVQGENERVICFYFHMNPSFPLLSVDYCILRLLARPDLSNYLKHLRFFMICLWLKGLSNSFHIGRRSQGVGSCQRHWDAHSSKTDLLLCLAMRKRAILYPCSLKSYGRQPLSFGRSMRVCAFLDFVIFQGHTSAGSAGDGLTADGTRRGWHLVPFL